MCRICGRPRRPESLSGHAALWGIGVFHDLREDEHARAQDDPGALQRFEVHRESNAPVFKEELDHPTGPCEARGVADREDELSAC